VKHPSQMLPLEEVRFLEATCTNCSTVDTLPVQRSKHDRYMLGADNVQDLFPHFSKDQRETIINADPPYQRGGGFRPYYVCPTCWPALIGDE
jgi:hypothetical protein